MYHHELNAPVPAGRPDFLKTATTPWDEGTHILSISYVTSVPSIYRILTVNSKGAK